jgi:hypothetical protein
MNVDVHPDDLLHRARRARPLSQDEQLYLDAHLRDCSTCRFVRDAGRAFDGEAVAGVPANVDALVERTMQRLRNPGGARRTMPRRLAAAAMTIVAMIGGVAFAGYWGSRHPAPAPAPVPTRAAALQAIRKHHADAPARADVAAAPVAGLVLVPVVATIPAADRAPRSVGPSRRRLALAPQPADVETAARVFEAANRARRQGDVTAAERAYETLWARFRATREAITSRAIAGQWMLDRRMPRAAIAFFHQYLAAASGGELEEDVLVGLADAHELAGESSAAVAVWRRLLVEHPGSVHAGRARDGLRRVQPGAAP